MRIVILGITAILATIAGSQAPAADKGFVVVRTDPLWIDSIGIGPGVCFSQSCAPGVVLKKDGTGALLKPTADGLQETIKFTFDPKLFQQLTTDVSKIRYRGLPCKMLMTDGGGASIFWSSGWQRTVINFTNGCLNKDNPAVTALYGKIDGMPEVRDAYQRARADTGGAH